MMDVAHLQIRVEADQVSKANRELRQMPREGKKAETATSGLVKAFAKLAGAISVVATARVALNKLVDTTRQFDILNAGLITATGSAEGAAKAFEALQDFAISTPFGLQQSAEAFVKLVNYGLTPSERALRSYGNTASAMGKSLEQMIEAVADATTGEFERLKEFGIRASKEGDRVTFTFRGMKETVGFNAREIEEYLTRLGEVNFADAMSNRMATLDGALANLGDSWDQFWLKLSQTGAGDAIEATVRRLNEALEDLNSLLDAGVADEVIGHYAEQLEILKEAAQPAIEALRSLAQAILFEDHGGPSGVGRVVGEIFKAYVERYVGFAADLRAASKWIFTDASLEEVLEERRAALDRYWDRVLRIQQKSQAALNPEVPSVSLDTEDPIMQGPMFYPTTDRLAGFRVGGTASSGVDREHETLVKKREQDLERLRQSLLTEEEALQASYDRRLAIIEQSAAMLTEAEQAELRTRLDKAFELERKELEKRQRAEIDDLRESLRTQEEEIQESYLRRMEIILSNSDKLSEAERATLMDRLNDERDAQFKALAEAKQREKDTLLAGLRDEEELIAESYERRRRAILESTILTEQERQAALAELARQHREAEEERNRAHVESILSHSEDMFANLARLAQGRNREQTKAYKALFAISKAFSITQATMSIATGIAKAQELGFPANLAEMARVAAIGTQVLATITSSNFAGAYDQGGRIPAGKIGLVGEYGPEFVRGPAVVTSRKDTRDLIEKAAASTPAPEIRPTNIRIINAFDTSALGDYLGSEEGEKIVLNIIQRNRNIVRTVVGV